MEAFVARYPDKFQPDERIFANISRGNRIFIGTGCGEPQHLVQALIDYVRSNPKALFGAEILQVWTLGVAPYTDERLQANVLRGRSHARGGQPGPGRLHTHLPVTSAGLVPPPPDRHRRRAHPDVAARSARLPQPRHQRGHRQGGRKGCVTGGGPDQPFYATCAGGWFPARGRGGLPRAQGRTPSGVPAQRARRDRRQRDREIPDGRKEAAT